MGKILYIVGTIESLNGGKRQHSRWLERDIRMSSQGPRQVGEMELPPKVFVIKLQLDCGIEDIFGLLHLQSSMLLCLAGI